MKQKYIQGTIKEICKELGKCVRRKSSRELGKKVCKKVH